MSIKQLMWLNLAVLIVLTGISCFASYLAIKSTSDLASQIKPSDTHLQEVQQEWQQQMLLIEQLVQQDLNSSHLVTENISSLLSQSVAREDRLVDDLRSQHKLSPDLLTQLDTNLLAYHQARDLLLRQASSGGLANISSLYQSADNLLDYGAYLVSLSEPPRFPNEKIINHLNEIGSRLVFLFIFAVMVAVFIFLIMEKNLLNPVLNITAQMRKLGRCTGNLRVHFHEDDTEIGQAAGATNVFLNNIRSLIAQLQSSSHALLLASAKINNSATRAAVESTIEVENIGQVAAVLQKAADTMEEVGEVAELASEASGFAVNNTRIGNHIVVMAQQGVDQITMEVELAFKSICGLLNQSQQVGALHENLHILNGQISQLAMAAAIETTRVRDPERGLAPLVEEARQIALRIGDLSVGFKKTLDNFSRGSAGAAELIALVQKQAVAIKSTIANASRAMNDVVHAVDEVKIMNVDIARVSGDEYREIASIRDNMTAILYAVRQHYSDSSNLEASRNHFEQQLVRMDGLLRDFRT